MTINRLMVAGVVMAFAIWGSVPLLGASGSEAPSPEETGMWVLSGDAERGGTIFATSCAPCHGAKGDGNGQVRLRDVTMPDFRDRATTKKETYYEWFKVIRDGGGAHGLCNTMVPAGHRMDEQSIHDLVAYLRTLPATAYVARARSNS